MRCLASGALLLAAACWACSSSSSSSSPDVVDPADAVPEPSATETNFRNRRCTSDTDCGEAARCDLQGEAGANPAPGDVDAGSTDAGAAAGSATGGRCVPLS